MMLWSDVYPSSLAEVTMVLKGWQYFQTHIYHSEFLSLADLYRLFLMVYLLQNFVFHAAPTMLPGTKVADSRMNISQDSWFFYIVSYHRRMPTLWLRKISLELRNFFWLKVWLWQYILVIAIQHFPEAGATRIATAELLWGENKLADGSWLLGSTRVSNILLPLCENPCMGRVWVSNFFS